MHLGLIVKHIDFLLVLNKIFSLRSMAEVQRAKTDRKLAISIQCCQFDPKFQVEWVAPTNHFCKDS